MDFQSIALPTELYHHPYWWGQRYKPFFIIQYAIVFFFVIYLCTMTELKNTLIIDAGNTSVKVALFIDNQLKSIERFRYTEIESLKEHLTKLNYIKSGHHAYGRYRNLQNKFADASASTQKTLTIKPNIK